MHYTRYEIICSHVSFFGLFRSKRGFAVTFTFSRGRIVGKEIFVEGNLLTYAKKQNFTGR